MLSPSGERRIGLSVLSHISVHWTLLITTYIPGLRVNGVEWILLLVFPFGIHIVQNSYEVYDGFGLSMERIFAVSDIHNLVGEFTHGDDRYRIFFTSWSSTFWTRGLQDRIQTLALWAAWQARTPSPASSEFGDDYDAPPPPPSPTVYEDFDWDLHRSLQEYRDRDPDSPFSDPLLEMERQDDCWGC